MQSGKRWLAAHKTSGEYGLSDTRKGNSGRPRERDLTLEEKYSRLEARNTLLKAENEFLKKILFAERRLNPTENFQLPKKQKTVEGLEKSEQDIVFLEKDELAHFLKLSKSDRLEMDNLVFTVLAYTGLRIGEMLALHMEEKASQKFSELMKDLL